MRLACCYVDSVEGTRRKIMNLEIERFFNHIEFDESISN